MKQKTAFRLIIVGCLIASALCIWGMREAMGSGTDVEVENEISTGDVTLNGGKSKAIGLGRSSFDVDINDCRESTSWDTVLVGKQGVRLNPWCAAEVYEAKGLFHMAALMRCDIPEIAKHFATQDECVISNTVTHPVTHSVVEERPDEDEEEHFAQVLEQQSIIDMQQAELYEVEARLEKLETRRTRAPAKTNPVGLTDGQRAALAEVFKE